MTADQRPKHAAVARRERRIFGYIWASPATAIGLSIGVVALCLGAKARIVDGVVEIGGERRAAPDSSRRRIPFDAITFGHVILSKDPVCLAHLRAHEHVHVRQYERWGALFFAAYAVASGIEVLRGRNPYWWNRFEREARAKAGQRSG